MAENAGRLLNQAPVGPPREGQLSESEFLQRARDVTWQPVQNVAQATRALEELATSFSVAAHVESVPAGVEVQYRRTYQSPHPSDPTVTTNSDESLDMPAYYVFRAHDPGTGKMVEQTKDCLRGCTVRFVFRRLHRQ